MPESKGGFGGHTAPDDFRLTKRGRIIGHGQAKVNNDPHDAAVNFTNKKYFGMQKITTVEAVPKIIAELDKMLKKGEISQRQYEDAITNFTGMLTDPETGITSGGTTIDELKKFKGKDGKISAKAVKKYARQFEAKQFGTEIATTSIAMGASSAIMTGIVSGVQNGFDVIKGKKDLDSALREIGAEVKESGAKGLGTGALSSTIRIVGEKAEISLLSDSSAATVIAGGIIDSGVAIYEYALGEIDSKQLVENLQDTVIKSTTTIYFSKAVSVIFGAGNPFVSAAIYSVANYVVANTREIIKNAKLNAEEYERLRLLNKEAIKLAKEFHKEMIIQMEIFENTQKSSMKKLLNEFELSMKTSDNIDCAIYAIIDFANEAGLALQHTNFCEFSAAMASNKQFTLQ